MRRTLVAILLAVLGCSVVLADTHKKVFKWTDEHGVTHYGDSIPAEYAELEKQVVNDAGVTVDVLQGKKTEEELAAERREQERRTKIELQRRADQALLATYLSVDEIELHRDRRVELFQAQARVTELYLRNLQKRLDALRQEASKYQPYNTDTNAPMIDPDLSTDLNETRETIERHQANLERFREDEQQIVARFDSDIDRFKQLKGLN